MSGATPNNDAAWVKLKDDLRNFRVGKLPQVFQRLEISDLCQNFWQFNLFILALRELMEQPTVNGDLRKARLEEDWLSYFHLSAIHGAPDVDWANVPMNWYFSYLKKHNLVAKQWALPAVVKRNNLKFSGTFPDRNRVGNPKGGYCVHHSPLFLPWHRPYLALLEQMIVVTAIEIAKLYSEPDRSEALKAAKELRFPFWDFSRPASGDYMDPSSLKYHMPPPLACKFVRVRKPGKRVFENVPNPLYSFQYPTNVTVTTAFPHPVYSKTETASAGEDFVTMIKAHNPIAVDPCFTTRNPDKGSGNSSTESLNHRLNDVAQVQKMRVYYTLTRLQDFPQVSCAKLVNNIVANKGKRAVTTDKSIYYTASLENIHDDYHILIGGYKGNDKFDDMEKKLGIAAKLDPTNTSGTFTNASTAAYEPSFWLMHNFWEYTACLWQNIHPERYWKRNETVRRNDDNCAWLRADSLETVQTPLVPFRKRVEGLAIFVKRDEVFWTTENCEDWTQFGYTFPDCPTTFTKYKTSSQVQQVLSDNKNNAMRRVNALYGFIYSSDAVSAAAIEKTEGLAEPSTTGVNLFKYVSPAWDPTQAETKRNDGKKVRDYYPIVNYTNQQWFPKMKPNKKLTDDTLITDLEEDEAPSMVAPRTFAMALAGKSIVEPRVSDREGIQVPGQDAIELEKQADESVKYRNLPKASLKATSPREVADHNVKIAHTGTRHEQNRPKLVGRDSSKAKTDNVEDRFDAKQSVPAIFKSHTSHPTQHSKHIRSESHKSPPSRDQKASKPAIVETHKQHTNEGVKGSDIGTPKSYRSRPSVELKHSDFKATKSHKPSADQDAQMPDLVATKSTTARSKQDQKIPSSSSAKTPRFQASGDANKSSTTMTASYKPRHSRDLTKEIHKSGGMNSKGPSKAAQAHDADSDVNQSAPIIDASPQSGEVTLPNDTKDDSKGLVTAETIMDTGATLADGTTRSTAEPRYLDCDKDGNALQWNFVYQVQKFGLFGMFTVHVFVGDFPVSSAEWERSANYVHTSGVWTRTLDRDDPENTSCAKCQVQIRDEAMYGDWVPLTKNLLRYVISGAEEPPNSGMVLRSMDPEDVIPFLKRNLHWRIIDIDGHEVARDQVPGLLVYVVSEPVRLPEKPTDLPIWGEVSVHHEITHERPSGLCHPGEAE